MEEPEEPRSGKNGIPTETVGRKERRALAERGPTIVDLRSVVSRPLAERWPTITKRSCASRGGRGAIRNLEFKEIVKH